MTEVGECPACKRPMSDSPYHGYDRCEPVPCPDCGKSLKNPKAIGPHNRHDHGYQGTQVERLNADLASLRARLEKMAEVLRFKHDPAHNAKPIPGFCSVCDVLDSGRGGV
jgi:hypothetical protein